MLETIAGTGLAPAVVLMFIEELPDTAMTVALERGGREHAGWGQDRHLLADIYDLLGWNTRVSWQGSKPPEIPHWPRPEFAGEAGDTDASAPKRTSVKDFFNRFTARR